MSYCLIIANYFHKCLLLAKCQTINAQRRDYPVEIVNRSFRIKIVIRLFSRVTSGAQELGSLGPITYVQKTICVVRLKKKEKSGISPVLVIF